MCRVVQYDCLVEIFGTEYWTRNLKNQAKIIYFVQKEEGSMHKRKIIVK